MNAIQNQGFLQLFSTGLPSGFVPSVGYVYTAGSTNTIVITDNTTYASGYQLKIVQVQVTDDNGISVYGHTTTTGSGGAVTLSTAGLDATSGFNIKVTIDAVPSSGSGMAMRADLGAYGVGSSAPSSGNLSGTNVQLQ